jgi:hypothetical protein
MPAKIRPGSEAPTICAYHDGDVIAPIRESRVIAITTLLVTFPLGYLLTDRRSASLAYLAVFAHVFTFQTAILLPR